MEVLSCYRQQRKSWFCFCLQLVLNEQINNSFHSNNEEHRFFFKWKTKSSHICLCLIILVDLCKKFLMTPAAPLHTINKFYGSTHKNFSYSMALSGETSEELKSFSRSARRTTSSFVRKLQHEWNSLAVLSSKGKLWKNCCLFRHGSFYSFVRSRCFHFIVK